MTDMNELVRRLRALREHLSHQPLTHADAQDMKTLSESASFIEHSAKETDAARDVLAERRRQVEAEGWTPKHDDEHTGGEMARAAASYALGKARITNLGQQITNIWPWKEGWWKPADQRRNLVKAGALILAEIERLDRKEASNG